MPDSPEFRPLPDPTRVALRTELDGLLNKKFIRPYRYTEAERKETFERVNQIAFLFEADILHVDPDAYESVSIIDSSDDPSERLEKGYHPDDVFVPAYGIDVMSGTFKKSGQHFAVWREKGIGVPSNAGIIWDDKTLLWNQIAEKNRGGYWGNIERCHPVAVLKRLRDEQIRVGGDPALYNTAISQIYSTLELPIPEQYQKYVSAESLEQADKLLKDDPFSRLLARLEKPKSIEDTWPLPEGYSGNPILWDPKKGWKWIEIARNSGRLRHTTDPFAFLEERRINHIRSGMNTTEIDQALAEIEKYRSP